MDQTTQNQTPLQDLPIGMAYIPLQRWQKVYDPAVGFDRGTIFEELDKPFLGEEAVPRG